MLNDKKWNVTPAFVANDTTIFRGCTKYEMIVLFIGWSVFWFPIMGVVSNAQGGSKAIQASAIFLAMFSIYVSAEILQILKTGKPDGFYQHKSILWMQRFGMFKNRYINRSQTWDVIRTEQSPKSDSALVKFIKVS